jgi:hypothetical protein
MLLILAFAMPMICFALSPAAASADSGAMPGGCHRHHGSMPPVQACCYALHPALMASPAASPVALHHVGGWVSASAISQPRSRVALAVVANDSSPLIPAVLRI